MESEAIYKVKKESPKRISKRVLFGILCFVILAAIIFAFIFKSNSSAQTAAAQQRTARVTTGNLSVTVTGSGAISSSNRADLSSSVSGKITKIYFKEGDNVKAGDLLFDLDDTEGRLNIEKIQNSIAQTQLSVNSNQKSLNNLDVKAPFSGQVTNIDLKAGDDVMKGASLLTITDSSKLKITIPFSGSVINEIKLGQKATANVQDTAQSVDGVVSYVSDTLYTIGNSTKVFDVEVTLNNPGSLKSGMSASVKINAKSGTKEGANAGKLEYVNFQIIKSISGGTVKSVYVKENQHVSAGQILVKLQNDDLVVSSQTTDLKLDDLNAQLESAQKQLADYKIYSPIDGVIVSQTAKVGDAVKPADVLGTITDMGHMEFSIPIDELDIAKIQTGQKVNITVDAISETTDKPLTGEVTKIAMEGTSSNGVTTYPVTIKIDEADKLRVGMNANAEIMINEKTGVLLVPLEAVQKTRRGSFVMIKGDGQNTGNASPWGNGAGSGNRRNSANAQYYANAVMTPVELGINNDEYVEVVNGLQEGDTVILPPLATSSTQNNTQIRSGFGGMGGGFGGIGGGFGSGRNSYQRGNSSSQSSGNSSGARE